MKYEAMTTIVATYGDFRLGVQNISELFHGEFLSKMDENRGYPLVMTNIVNWKDPPCFMGKFTMSMVTFNSYILVITRGYNLQYP